MPAPTLPDLPSNGTRANVDKYNAAFQYVIGLLSQLDDDNISSVSGTKVTDGTLPLSALSAAARQGWMSGSFLPAPNSVTYNGQHSYDLVFNSLDLTSILSKGMRLRANRTLSAPTQSTSLNGSTQYWVKTSPNKSTFTDDFVCTAYIKLSSYATGGIISRWNGTSGWVFRVNSDGTLEMFGSNAGAANFSTVKSVVAVPLDKWIRVTAQLDMSSFTASTTTSYMMIDGVDVPAAVTRGGTNPTALVQAGNLEVGSYNAGAFFPGKIAQAAFFTAKVTQATMRSYDSQTFSGSETSLGSAYSFNNSVVDLNTTTPNDLSVGGGSAVATNADSPFGNGLGLTKEYGIIMAATFSTNTTVTVQVPEGCALPTSGGIASLEYSTLKVPFGFPEEASKWTIRAMLRTANSTTIGSFGVWYPSTFKVLAPTGAWTVINQGSYNQSNSSNGLTQVSFRINTVSHGVLDNSTTYFFNGTVSSGGFIFPLNTRSELLTTAQETLTIETWSGSGGGAVTGIIRGDIADASIALVNNYL